MDNIFVEIDGIKGETTSAQGKDMIELLSFSHGVSQPLVHSQSGQSRASGRSDHQDVTFSKYLEISSPTLNLKCCSGADIKFMKFHFWRADSDANPIKYLSYELTDCIITSIGIGAGGGSQPVETVTVNYGTIKWIYAKQGADAPGGSKGKAQAGWDLGKNKKL
jgi:type VI secretion system secreted protein Hcp